MYPVYLADLDPVILNELKNQVSTRYTQSAVRIRADVSVTCYTYEGVEAIKKSLAAAQAVQTQDVPISIKLVAPPLFVLTTSSTDKEAGVERLQLALDTLEKEIKGYGGNIFINMAPKAISQTEDVELEKLLQRAEDEKRQVSGDDDSDME